MPEVERYRYRQPDAPERLALLEMPVGLIPPPTLTVGVAVPGAAPVLLVYVGEDLPRRGLPRWYLAGSWIYWRHDPSTADYCVARFR